MSKKIIAILSVISILMGITGCSNKTATDNNNNVVTSNYSEDIDTNIVLGDNISVEGNGVVVEDNKVTITSSGKYGISGTLNDGQIIINAGDEDNVELVLNGANITSSNSAPIYVMNAKNAYLILEDGSENILTDSENYAFEDANNNEPNATIFSNDDLFISGTGKLIVNSNYNNAIASDDDLEVGDANIEITSVADGLRGKDSITINSGTININATGDGIKSNNTEDTTKGYVLINGGTINITSGEDGIQAETTATIAGGDLTINTGGGSVNGSQSSSWGNFGKGMFGGNNNTSTSEDTASAKAIKASVLVQIDGGTINIDSADDSIHSNSNAVINGGTINITSGDDGIHGDSTVDINDGEINITKSYEGIEAETININNGNIKIVASDDGINAAGGNDGSSVNGRPGQNMFASSGSGSINLNGGRVAIDASGDGIDANGSINMKDGVVIVNGPENDGNGALDYDKEFIISGGLFIASGSTGMAQSPSTTSSQNSINVFTSVSANTILHIEDESGNELITFAPSKSAGSIVISSPDIKTGTTYNVYTGGESTGTATDGLYSQGSYSGGTKGDSFTVSSTVTNVGENSGGFRGPGGGSMPGQRGEMPSRP